MKALLLLLCVLLGWWYFASEYSPATLQPWSQASEEDFPDWRDVARENDASGVQTNAASLGTASAKSPAAIDSSNDSLSGWWGRSGGVTGILGGWLRGITDSIGFFLFGRPGEPGRQWASKPDIPADLTKHFSKVEDATVTIDFGINAPGMPEAGATGFIVAFQGRTYVATNIHVLEAFAEREAALVWYEGSRTSQFGERDSLKARRRIAYSEYLNSVAGSGLPTFKTKDGAVLVPNGPMLLSDTCDVALLLVNTDIAPLSFSTKSPSKEQNVFIVSNPEARGTLYLVRASTRGIGPDRMELRVDGEGLVPGMSGSPVVSATDGTVVGIVSYRYEREEFDPEKVLKDHTEGTWARTGSPQVRDFAFRSDNLRDLRPVAWSRFCFEMGIIHSLHERTRNVLIASDIPLRDWLLEPTGRNLSSSTANRLRKTEFVPHVIHPDFNSTVSMHYNSMVNSLRGVSENGSLRSVYSSVDAYKRRLEFSLDSAARQVGDLLRQPPLTVPYLRRVAEQTVERDRQIVLAYIRRGLGHLPGRGRQ